MLLYIICTIFYKISETRCKYLIYFYFIQLFYSFYSYGGIAIDSTEYGKTCATNGWNGESDTLSEDCLNVVINVKQSTLESGNKVPIVYFIHGGGFQSGNNQGNFPQILLSNFFLQNCFSQYIAIFIVSDLIILLISLCEKKLSKIKVENFHFESYF